MPSSSSSFFHRNPNFLFFLSVIFIFHTTASTTLTIRSSISLSSLCHDQLKSPRLRFEFRSCDLWRVGSWGIWAKRSKIELWFESRVLWAFDQDLNGRFWAEGAVIDFLRSNIWSLVESRGSWVSRSTGSSKRKSARAVWGFTERDQRERKTTRVRYGPCKRGVCVL